MKTYKQLLKEMDYTQDGKFAPLKTLDIEIEPVQRLRPQTPEREAYLSSEDFGTTLTSYDPAKRFAKLAHETSRTRFDPTGTNEFYQETPEGELTNMNVPYEKLHPHFRSNLYKQAHDVYFAVLNNPDDDESAAKAVHSAWAAHHEMSPVPYEQLADDEKERGRAYVQIMKHFIKQESDAHERYEKSQPVGMAESRSPVSESTSLQEAIQYHKKNGISLVENVFRPGSDNFFDLIAEAKRLYNENSYTPKDEYEKEILESDIGEIAEYEGRLVVLDFPIEEEKEADDPCWKGYVQRGMKKKGKKMVPNCIPLKEEKKSDPTKGRGIGKPFREGGGGAVYVKSGGRVKKVSFSKSGMKKKFNDPGAVKSFVSRHNCLSNKDKTSAAYWACRWPRYFSDSGKKWW